MIKSYKLLLFFSIFTLVFASCSDENTDTVENIEALSRLNLSYGSDARQVYDLYLPEGRSLDTKVIILLHGGS